ncbi:MAG: DoxX family protein [Acidiferrobacterales bacterium]
MTILENWRKTSNDKLGGALRIVAGIVFLLAGLLKMTVPSLGVAFAGQISAASIPFPELTEYSFPVVETVLGVMLLAGLHARISALIAAMSMVVATYVHLVVDDPALFPLQPVEPIGPLVLIAMLLYTVFRGAGAWSMDLKESV